MNKAAAAEDTIKISPRIRESLANNLKKVALERRVSQTAIVEEALDCFFENIEFDTPTSRRLEDLMRQSKRMARDNEVMLEAFAFYVRIFLTHLPQINDTDKEKAEKLGGVRYEKYLAALGQRFKNGKLFSKVIEDKIASIQDFEANDK